MPYKDPALHRAANTWSWFCSPGRKERLARMREKGRKRLAKKRAEKMQTIFDSKEYFLCDHYDCQMSKAACIARQKDDWKRYGDFQDEWCIHNCEQGKGIGR